MKSLNKKRALSVSVILIMLVGIVAIILLNLGTVVISLKSEYAEFIESNGFITEVKFHIPANFNAVELESENQNCRDEHGNEYQTIIYNGNVKKVFFASMPIITINRSCTYVFVFSDKIVTITDGKITDPLS